MDNLLTVAGQVAILFALMAVGAVLRWLRLITGEALDGMINLLLLVVTPCLIVDVFQRPFDPSMLKGLAFAFVASAAFHLVVIALARVSVRHQDENVRRPLLLAAVFSNAGFMGVPLEQAVLGDAGVFFGVVYIAVFNLFMWSWGLKTMMNEELRIKNGGKGHSQFAICNSQFLKMWINPGTVGLAFGLPLFLLSVRLPAILQTPIHLIAGLNTPLAMIIIGYCLFGAKLGKVVRMPSVLVAAVLRLVVSPLLMIAALYPFRQSLDRNMMLALSIAAAAPVAAMVSMFASKFGRDVDVSVAIVSGTTLLSILTMPVLIALAMAVL